MKTTAERLQEAIDKREMTQTELAKKTGISKSSINTYLSGKYIPRQTNLKNLSIALDVDLGWLMGADVPMQPIEELKTTAELTAKLKKDKKGRELLSNYYSLSEKNKNLVFELINTLQEAQAKQ